MIRLALLWAFCLSAHAEFAVPALTGPVVDNAQMLSPAAEQKLSAFLRRLHESGGAQVQVATVPDLGGLSIEEASIKITDQWKLGQAKTDNGILILASGQERRVRIEVGQGWEGVIPDMIASRIVNDVMIARFKSGDMDRGMIDGVLAVVHYTNPDFLEGQQAAGSVGKVQPRRGVSLHSLLMFAFFFFFLLPLLTGGRGRRRSGLGGALLGYGLGRAMGGRGGGFGGSGGGGWGGGGWGGGGGGFSGGGASGGW